MAMILICISVPLPKWRSSRPSSSSNVIVRKDVALTGVNRRMWAVISTIFVSVAALPEIDAALAIGRGRRIRKNLPLDAYKTNEEGLKYYDTVEGKGIAAEQDDTVLVHFDCVYKRITVVSSRESKILSGNRTLAQPYELVVGSVPGRERKREFADNANGLFSAQAAPKPPPALYSAVAGMHVGGIRTVIVPPESGYGERGINEIPPNATFELNIQLLQVKKRS